MGFGKKLTKTVRVADWMTEGVLAVETFDSIAIARQLMAKHRINQLPVLDNDNLVESSPTETSGTPIPRAC